MSIKMKRKLSGKTKILLITTAVISFASLLSGLLLFFGVIHFNHPDPDKYPVKGVDVSNYQGEIDWATLSKEDDIRFAYIKATEGSSFVDKSFEYNRNEAQKAGLRIGAYHFFSFESSGKSQAEHFCNTVNSINNMLPPVIDVEYYGEFRSDKDIDTGKIKAELRIMADQLCSRYGIKPVIYCSKDTYNDIIKDDFTDCDLWYRSVYSSVPSDIDWTFWQYSNRHRLDGYDGDERYIDMNVFSGSAEEFELYPRKDV